MTATRILLAIVGATIVTSSARAEDEKEKPHRLRERIRLIVREQAEERNGRVVDIDDITASIREAAGRLDTDGDGKISIDEAASGTRDELRKNIRLRIEQRRDGEDRDDARANTRQRLQGLDIERIEQVIGQMMGQLDRDGDGKVSDDEVQQAGAETVQAAWAGFAERWENFVDEAREQRAQAADELRQRLKQGRPSQVAARAMVGLADENGDGVVTRQEAENQTQKAFDEADADKDGKLSVDEIQAAIQKRAEQAGEEIRRRLEQLRKEITDG